MQYTGHVPAVVDRQNTNAVAYCDEIISVLKCAGASVWLIELVLVMPSCVIQNKAKTALNSNIV